MSADLPVPGSSSAQGRTGASGIKTFRKQIAGVTTSAVQDNAGARMPGRNSVGTVLGVVTARLDRRVMVRLGRGLTAAFTAAAVGVVPVLVATPAQGVACVAQLRERPAAVKTAVDCDMDVAITGETTPWSTTTATPEGLVRLSVTPAAQRTRYSAHTPGQWTATDARFSDLDPADGRVDVTAPVFPMSVSDGTAGEPLAVLTTEQGATVIDVPFELPAPRVGEDMVTYEDVVAGGVDLIVRTTPDGTGLVPEVVVATPAAWADARDVLGALQLAVTTSEGLSLDRADEGLLVADAVGEQALSWTAPLAAAADAAARPVGLKADVTSARPKDAERGREEVGDLAVDAFVATGQVGGVGPAPMPGAEGDAVAGADDDASAGSVSGMLGQAVDPGTGTETGTGKAVEGLDANTNRIAEAVRADALANVSTAGVRVDMGAGLADVKDATAGGLWPVRFGLGTVAGTQAGWTALFDDGGATPGAGFLAGPDLPAGSGAEGDRRIVWSLTGLGEVGLLDEDAVRGARFTVPVTGGCQDVDAEISRVDTAGPDASLLDHVGTWTQIGEGTTPARCDGATGQVSFDVTEEIVQVAEIDTTATTLGLTVPGATTDKPAPAGGSAKAAVRSAAKTLDRVVVQDGSMATFAAAGATLTLEFAPSAESLSTTAETTVTDPDSLLARENYVQEVTEPLADPSAAPTTAAVGTAEAQPAPEPSVAPSDDLPVAASATIPVGSTAMTADVGGMDVTVKAPTTGAPAPTGVDVAVQNQAAADAEGVTGVVLTLDDATATTPAPGEPARQVDLTFDYTDFEDVAGAGWADRLGLLRFPACAEITPDAPECQPVRIPTRNNPDTSSVAATVELPTEAGAQALAAVQEEAATEAGAAKTSSSSDKTAASESTMSKTAAASESTSALAATTTASGSAPPTAQDRYAIVSGTQSASGNWGATPLAASSSWSVSGGTGSFSWSYPLDVPKPSGGPSPDLTLGYSSASLDGMVTHSNTQSSAVGLGWDMTTGYIERRFVPCASDLEPYATETGTSADPNNVDRETGDLCWGPTDAVSLVFNGHSAELVRDGDVWRPKNDDGTRVKLLTGGTNADDNNEYWEITTTDGIRYYFGKDRRFEGDTLAQNSTWTVPVYGNHPARPGHLAEPGYATKFADSETRQAWRWNLDYVVDLTGRSMTYVYQNEDNRYGADLDRDGDTKVYDRGGYLKYIEYGTVAGNENTGPAPYRVELAYAERCLGATSCAEGDLVKGNGWRWYDTPVDLQCAKTTSCKNTMSPAFFTRKRLTQVTTRVRNEGGYQNVDQYTLNHRWKSPGDGTNNVLWLQSITHKAVERGNGAVPAQETWFTPTAEQLPGRVNNTPNDGLPAMNRIAMQAVHTPTGGTLSVHYRTPACTPSSPPANPTDAEQRDNTKPCMPVTWTPVGEEDEITEWFHKHLVASITQDPGTASTQPAVETRYEYYGGAHWARTPSALTPLKDIDYADFRGFTKAATITGRAGNPDSPPSKTVTEYFRGTGETLTATADVAGEAVDAVDNERFAGMPFQTTVLNGAGDGAEPVTISTNSYEQVKTATNQGWNERSDHPDDNTFAHRIKSSMTWTRVLRANGDTSSVTRQRTEFNEFGQTTLVSDAGGIHTSDDELCTTTDYNPNADKHIYVTVEQTRTIAAPCGSAGKLVAARKVAYDGNEVGVDPTRALMTKSLMPNPANPLTGNVDKDSPLSWVTAQEVTYESSARARPLTVKDPLGRVARTAYTDTTVGVQVGMTETSPDPDGSGPLTAHVSSTELDPYRGIPVSVTDPNGKKTVARYDDLGRLIKVWFPDRPTTQTPSIEYTYTIRASGINAVTTSTLGADGQRRHLASVLYDGLLRQIQTQKESADPAASGRVVTSTIYDYAGRTDLVIGEWYVNGAAQDKFLTLATQRVVAPAKVMYKYDGAGRVVKETFSDGNIDNRQYDRWSTVTEYDGMFTRVTPPDGATPTTTRTDARGRMVELQQHIGDADGDGDPDHQSTAYEYDPEGRLMKVVEKSTGNATSGYPATWTYTYDVLGRQVETSDPDRGITKTRYDLAGQTLAVTDAVGETIATKYDNLGRKTGTYDATIATNGDITFDKLRAEWVYDRLTDKDGVPDPTGAAPMVVKGQATASIRHNGGNKYVTSVVGYDAAYRPTGSRVTIPASNLVTGVDGTYETSYQYTADGQVKAMTLPAAGGLGQETVTTYFDEKSLPDWMGGGFGWGTYVADSGRTIFGEQSWLDLGNTYAGVVSYQYEEGTRRLTGISLDRERISGTDLDVTYTYDDAGNITSQTDAPTVNNGGVAPDGQCFEYDALNRLTEAWTPAVTPASPNTPAMADCAAPKEVDTLAGPGKYWDSWSFQGNGNRESWTHRTPDGETKTSYQYDATKPHQLTGVTIDAPTETVSEAFTYDAAGNTATRLTTVDKAGSDSTGTTQTAVSNQTLGIDREGELTSLTTKETVTEYPAGTQCEVPAGADPETACPDTGTGTGTGTVVGTGEEITNNIYSADGERLVRINRARNSAGTMVVTGVTAYVGGGQEVTKNASGSVTATRYYTFGGQTVAVRTGKGMKNVSSLVADHHGTPLISVPNTDWTTNKVVRNRTTPYGATRSGSGTIPGDHRFLGKTRDAATGYTLVGARWYDEQLGRFLSVDPVMDLTDPQQWNGYSYSHNNPTTYSDPSGLREFAGDGPGDPDSQAEIHRANQNSHPGYQGGGRGLDVEGGVIDVTPAPSYAEEFVAGVVDYGVEMVSGMMELAETEWAYLKKCVSSADCGGFFEFNGTLFAEAANPWNAIQGIWDEVENLNSLFNSGREAYALGRLSAIVAETLLTKGAGKAASLIKGALKKVDSDGAAMGGAAGAGALGARAANAADDVADAATGPGTAIRRVGDVLETPNDVIANPRLLEGRHPGTVAEIFKDSGWEVGALRRGRNAGSGWTLRELNARGTDYTGRYIQWHPGSRRHFGGAPYWKVSDGTGGTVRFPQ